MAAIESTKPTTSNDGQKVVEAAEYKVPIRRSLDLFGAMSMIIGAIIGSGIFISPKGVLQYTGSVGLNLIIWALCGIIALCGGFCLAELGTLVKESGGQWAYVRVGLGGAPAFIIAWTYIVLSAVSTSVITLASSDYLLTTFYSFNDMGCAPPELATKLMGIVILWLALMINTSMTVATKVLKVLFVMKILALCLIIVGGFYWMAAHGVGKLHNSFEGTTDNPWSVAVAFYSGLWAYDGWETANYVTEEVKDIKRTMPRAIIGSTLLVTCLYLLVNLSYYSVLTPEQVLESSAVAVDWGYQLVGRWSSLFSIVVSLSIFGSALASVFGNSRILMALAREGHTAQVLSMVSISDNAPLVSLLARGVMATIIGIIGDMSSLINFFSFCTWLFYFMVFTSLVILKRKGYHADDDEVFRVPMFLPIIMMFVAAYLVVVPIASDPQLPYLFAGLFMLGGLVFYFPFVYHKRRVIWFEKVSQVIQIILRVNIPDKRL